LRVSCDALMSAIRLLLGCEPLGGVLDDNNTVRHRSALWKKEHVHFLSNARMPLESRQIVSNLATRPIADLIMTSLAIEHQPMTSASKRTMLCVKSHFFSGLDRLRIQLPVNKRTQSVSGHFVDKTNRVRNSRVLSAYSHPTTCPTITNGLARHQASNTTYRRSSPRLLHYKRCVYKRRA
jgi:hypothetical protein